jgi:hypothetical protein
MQKKIEQRICSTETERQPARHNDNPCVTTQAIASKRPRSSSWDNNSDNRENPEQKEKKSLTDVSVVVSDRDCDTAPEEDDCK